MIQVGQDFAVRAEDAGLIIRDAMRFAELANDRLGGAQAVARNGGEEVMLNLVVETAVPEVGDRVRFDIASRDYLTSQEVEGGLFLQHRHAFMVGGKNGAEVEARETLVNQHEYYGLPDAETEKDNAKVADVVSHKQGRFGGAIFTFMLEEEADAHALHVDDDKQEQGEEKVGLAFDDKTKEFAFTFGIFGGKREDWDIDVGVHAALVGMTMVLVVLVEPPGVAQAETKVAGDEAEGVIFPGLAKNLAMTGIVSEQAELGEDEGQVNSVKQLDPEHVDKQQNGDPCREQHEVQQNFEGIINRLLLQQAVLSHQFF